MVYTAIGYGRIVDPELEGTENRIPTVPVRIGRSATDELAAETADGQLWHITENDIVGGLISLQ